MPKDYKISLLLDYYGDMLTAKQREAAELYYNEDLSLFEIAEHLHITRQGVHDSIRRSESFLEEMEEKLGMAKKLHAIADLSESIRLAADEIRLFNEKYLYSKEIKSYSGVILECTEKMREALA